MIMNMVKPYFNQNIPDPYYMNGGFEEAYQMLSEACEQVIQKYNS